jgi:hypothetical protein
MNTPRTLNQKKIDATRALFKTAETNLKNAEHLTNKVFIPAVNELRYAGYHIVGYLSSEGTDDDLLSAQKHCKRAIYDSAEGPLLKFLGDIAQFQDDYATTSVTLELPDYISQMKQVQEARNLIAAVQPDTREEYFEAVAPHLSKLNMIAGLLETARPEINKRIRNEQAQTRKEQRNLVIGVVSLFAAIIGAILAATGPIISTVATADSATVSNLSQTDKLPASSVVAK